MNDEYYDVQDYDGWNILTEEELTNKETEEFKETMKEQLRDDEIMDMIDDGSLDQLLDDIKTHNWEITTSEVKAEILDWYDDILQGCVSGYRINADSQIEFLDL